jgi:hypothetical protein
LRVALATVRVVPDYPDLGHRHGARLHAHLGSGTLLCGAILDTDVVGTRQSINVFDACGIFLYRRLIWEHSKLPF